MHATRHLTRQRPAMPLLATTLASLALLFAGAGHAAETSAVVTHLSGTLATTRADGGTKLLSVNSEIREGDTLSTQQDTYARVKFSDGAEIVLRPNTQLKIDAYSYNEGQPAKDNFAVSLIKGGLRAVTGLLGRRSKEKTSFNTSTATIGIRGTHFGALLCADDCRGVPTVSGQVPENGLHLDVVAGGVSVHNAAGQQNIDAGQFGFVRSSNTAPTLVPADIGVRISVPPSISSNRAGGRSVGANENVECAP